MKNCSGIYLFAGCASDSMSVSVVTNAGCQPSVLNLLPFTKNCARSASCRSRSALAPGSGERTHGLPALPGTSSAKESKLGSRNAATSNTSSIKENIVCMCCRSCPHILKSSKLHHKHAQNADQRMSVKSVAANLANHVNVCDTTKTLTNSKDIKCPYRCKVQEDSYSITSTESNISNADPDKFVAKSLPKPVFRPADYRWYHTSKKNSNPSMATSLIQNELKRHKLKADSKQTTPTFQSRAKIKLRIKDLPRSKTPLAEHDPDKLNIQHVIAFLQSSCSKSQEDLDWSGTSNKQAPLKPLSPTSKRVLISSDSGSTGENGAHCNHTQQITKPNGFKCERIRPALAATKEAAAHPGSSSRPESHSVDSHKTTRHDIQASSKLHIKPVYDAWPDGRLSGDRVSSRERHQAAVHAGQCTGHNHVKSLEMPQPAEAMSLSDRHDIYDKFFRLQQPSTLACKRSINISDESKRSSLNNALYSWDNVSEVPNTDESFQKVDKYLKQTIRCYSETMSDNVLPKGRRRAGTEKRSKSKSVQISDTEAEQIRNVNQVICLPSVHLDGDSEDECSSRSDVACPENDKQEFTFSEKDHSVQKLDKEKIDRQDHQCTQSLQRAVKEDNVVDITTEDTTLQGDATLADNEPRVVDTESDHPWSSDASRTTAHESEELFTTQAVNESFKRMKTNIIPTSFNQETLIKLLNHEINANKAQKTWFEIHSEHFSPIFLKKTPDGATSPSILKEEVKLSLRKERNKTREYTYMTDMKGGHFI